MDRTLESDETSSNASSVDTNAALLELLGIDEDDFEFNSGECSRGQSPIGDEDECSSSLRESGCNIRQDTKSYDSHQSNSSAKRNVQVIDLPTRCSRYLHAPSQCCAFVIPAILSPAECRYLIQKAGHSNTGFHYITEASHIDDGGNSICVKLQHPNPHKLSVYQDDAFLHNVLWKRLTPYLEPGKANEHVDAFFHRTKCGKPLGLNPRVRVLKYDAADNDRFESHFDATTRVGDRTSLLTVLVYLNDGDGVDFDGGETLYLDSHVSNLNNAQSATYDCDTIEGENKCTKISPRTGDCVIFEHDLYHQGAPLQRGTKYVMRTDVMFRSQEAGIDAAAECRRRKAESEESAKSTEVSTKQIESCISALASQVGLSSDEREYLNSLGILNVTAHSFLAAGAATIRLILCECVNEDKVNDLIRLATEAAKDS